MVVVDREKAYVRCRYFLMFCWELCQVQVVMGIIEGIVLRGGYCRIYCKD